MRFIIRSLRACLVGAVGVALVLGISPSAHAASPSGATTTVAALGPVTPLSRVPSGVNGGLVCATDNLYSIEATGQLKRLSNGVVTNVGTPAANVQGMNGLGIGRNGTTVLAYERTTATNITMWYFDGSAWHSTGDQFSSTDVNAFVAGAVDLKSGAYFFGGFGGGRFTLFRYLPGTGEFARLGYIDTSASGGGNGDMAFDANGNLYIVASATSTSVYSVSAAAVAAASGGLLPSTQSFSFTTANFANINGAAFNTTGGLFLGNTTTVREYNATTGELIKNVTTGLTNSTDLASCNSPASLVVHKNVTGRAAASDQFTLSVLSGTTVSATATTSGSATGVQAAQVGPLAVIQNRTYTVREVMASGSASSLSSYATTLVCTDETGATIVTASSPQAAITVPDRSGAAVDCTFTNAPLVATVTLHKTVQDIMGQNPANGGGWTLGASTSFTAGSGSSSPSATTQVTPTSGSVSWQLGFAASSSRATVRVSEVQQSAWEFVSGSCTVTSLGGATRTVTIASATGTDVPAVAPGDAVDCTLVNKPSSGTLTLRKQVDNTFGGTSTVSDWTLTGTGPQTITGRTGDAAVTNAVVKVGAYDLSEAGGPAGYAASAWTCTGGAVTGSQVAVAANATVVCTITNASKPGAVTWTKTAEKTGGLLAGSRWSITGPGFGASGTEIVDCVASPCGGPDQDPAPGAFRLSNLAWGSYSVRETLAPPGYVANRSFSFSVTAANAGSTQDMGAQVNAQQAGATLPLTGGVGRDSFLMVGGALLTAALLAALVLLLRRRSASSS